VGGPIIPRKRVLFAHTVSLWERHDVEVDAHPTPEEAAIAGFGEHAAVVLTAREGPRAAVLLLGDGQERCAYLALTERTATGWIDAGGGDANHQWRLTDEETGAGFLAWWAEVPEDATAARLRWKGSEYEVPSRRGYYLWVRAGVPEHDADEFIETAAVRHGSTWNRVGRDDAGRWLHERVLRARADQFGDLGKDE
jgi:hypothetical protein